VLVGKPRWLEDEGIDLSGGQNDLDRLQGRGLTAVGVAVDGDLIGLIGIGDEFKADAAETIARMKDAGITPAMLTGDNERTAHTVADAIGIDRVMAEVLPDDKRQEVGRLQNEGQRVAMAGDGINDAPALTQADVGIAIGAGTDIAIESADIVLMGDRLGGVMDAYEIGKTSYSKTKQNLIAAFGFNGIGVSAATTGLVHPVFAMIAMVLSVTAVLANSFAGQLISGGGINTNFSVETADLESEKAAVEDQAEPTEEPVEPSSDESTTDPDLADERSGREWVTFGVDLHCGACEDRVAETLDERDGVCDVFAEADDERVEVEFNPHLTSADEIRIIIEDSGYEVEETPPVSAD
jgi:cation transport ATPase